jgi:F-type H+-transporting ATPase subunit gamma
MALTRALVGMSQMSMGQLSMAAPASVGSVRGMATLKEIEMRLKGTRNIKKITSSMKMVSAAKYAQAERRLKPARTYGGGAIDVYDKTGAEGPEDVSRQLIIAISSDRGLCGGIHTGVNKAIKQYMATTPANVETKMFLVGDKCTSVIKKYSPDAIEANVKEYGRKPPTFDDASAVANAILECGFEFDKGVLLYNKFKTVVSYNLAEQAIFRDAHFEASKGIDVYDSIDADVLQACAEFQLASIIYFAMKENACSEQSARMTAMDNASKNASEMIEKLQVTYNRTRQAVITTELIEIISGAAAAENMS